MSLENYTGNISDLVATNPTGTDPRSQGDDHLRGIKFTLKQSFPLATGPVRVSGDKLFAGDSATQANNFVIDASADNGTMKLARESGQDIMTVDAAGLVAFPQNEQAWQNLTASRGIAIDYTNNTGLPITISVCLLLQPTTHATLDCSGARLSSIQNSTSSDMRASLYATVMPGQGYRVNTEFNSATVLFWHELRR